MCYLTACKLVGDCVVSKRVAFLLDISSAKSDKRLVVYIDLYAHICETSIIVQRARHIDNIKNQTVLINVVQVCSI